MIVQYQNELQFPVKQGIELEKMPKYFVSFLRTTKLIAVLHDIILYFSQVYTFFFCLRIVHTNQLFKTRIPCCLLLVFENFYDPSGKKSLYSRCSLYYTSRTY